MIPVIDLEPHLAARPRAATATAAALGRALQDVGFFVIVNHGFPQTYNAARQRDGVLPEEARRSA